MTQPTPETDQPNQPPAKPKRRWLRWIIGVVAVLVVGLVLVVALLPTLLSTGPGTNLVLGFVNDQVNGRVAAEDLSVGWFSGASMRGVEIFEPAAAGDDQLVATVKSLDTELTLLSALGGTLDFGETVGVIDIHRGRVDRNGKLNLAEIFAPMTEGDSDAETPAIAGNFDLQIDGSLEYPDTTGNTAGGSRTIKIDGTRIAAQVTDLAEPIMASVTLPVTDGRTTGKLVLDDVNIDPATLAGSGDIRLEAFDLALLDPVLQLAQRDERLFGVADAALSAERVGDVTTLAGSLTVVGLGADGLAGEVSSVDVGDVELRPDMVYDPADELVADVALLVDGAEVLVIDGALPADAFEDVAGLPAGDLRVRAELPASLVALVGPFLPAEQSGALSGLAVSAEALLQAGDGGQQLPFTVSARYGDGRDLTARGTVTELQLGTDFAAAVDGLDVTITDAADLLNRLGIDTGDIGLQSASILVQGGGRFAGDTFTPDDTLTATLTNLTATKGTTVLVRNHLVQATLLAPIDLRNGLATDAAQLIINGDRLQLYVNVDDLTQTDAGVVATADVRKLLVGDPSQLLSALDIPIDGFQIDGGVLGFDGQLALDTTGPTPTLRTLDPAQLTLDRMGVIQLADPEVEDSAPRVLLQPTDTFVVRGDFDLSDDLNLRSVRASLNDDALLIEGHADVTDLAGRREIADTRLLVNADLDRLTPKLRDILGETAGGRGPMIVDVRVDGSYPADDPDAIRKLDAEGVMRVQSLDAYGLQLRDGEMPVRLSNGVLDIDGGAGVNGGRANTDLALDLTQDVPVLSMPDRVQLLRDAQINSLVMQIIGSTAGSFGRQTTSAAGLIDVSLLEARQVPLDFEQLAAGRGRMRLAFSLRDMDIESEAIGGALGAVAAVPQLGSLLGQAGKFNRLRGLINDGELLIADGRADFNIALNVFDPREGLEGPLYPIGLTGNVDLATSRQNITFTLGPELTNKWFGDDLAKLLPATGLPVKITGTLDAPKYEPAVQVEDLLQNQLERGLRDLFE